MDVPGAYAVVVCGALYGVPEDTQPLCFGFPRGELVKMLVRPNTCFRDAGK